MNWLKAIRDSKTQIPADTTLRFDWETGFMHYTDGRKAVATFSTNKKVLNHQIGFLAALMNITQRYADSLADNYGETFAATAYEFSVAFARHDELKMDRMMDTIQQMINNVVRTESAEEDRTTRILIENELDAILNNEPEAI